MRALLCTRDIESWPQSSGVKLTHAMSFLAFRPNLRVGRQTFSIRFFLNFGLIPKGRICNSPNFCKRRTCASSHGSSSSSAATASASSTGAVIWTVHALDQDILYQLQRV